MTPPLLEVRSVSRLFGQLRALSDVSFTMAAGELLGMIGPNGAGKTTLIGALSGTVPPTSGDILFEGKSIVGLRPDRIARLGIIRTFQIVEPSRGMSVLECVMLGALYGRADAVPRRVGAAAERAAELLELVDLSDKAGMMAEDLNLPDRKRLEVARGLAARPQILLLDEVFGGLNGSEVDRSVRIIEAVRGWGVAIVLIEHVFDVIKRLSDRIMVLHHGEKIADGSVAEIQADPRVGSAYFGRQFAAQARSHK